MHQYVGIKQDASYIIASTPWFLKKQQRRQSLPAWGRDMISPRARRRPANPIKGWTLWLDSTQKVWGPYTIELESYVAKYGRQSCPLRVRCFLPGASKDSAEGLRVSDLASYSGHLGLLTGRYNDKCQHDRVQQPRIEPIITPITTWSVRSSRRLCAKRMSSVVKRAKVL